MFAAWVVMEILLMGLYVMQSSGDALRPMKVELTMRILHVALCPFLVLGLWIFPHLGVAGAALSNVIAQALGAVIIGFLLFSGRTRLKLNLKDFHFDFSLIRRILKIGIPALTMNLQRSIGTLVLTWFIAPFGTVAIAAHSLVSRVEMFIFMPSMGLGSGAGVLVGQNLGAKQPDRAAKGAWMAVGIVEVFMLLCAAAILVWANGIMSIFTTDPVLISMGALFLRIATSGYVVLALTTVLQNCIAGAGDTLPNMLISIFTMWLIQIPAAYLIPHLTGLGVYGIRWAIVASTIAAALASLAYFKTGKWQHKRV
jgi:putative MATE family efflux protein